MEPVNRDTFHQLARVIKRRTFSSVDTDVPSDLLREFGVYRPLLLVLVDGLGESYLQRLPSLSFLRQARESTLESVFPSTTACALTTLSTGLPPATHGIPGRYGYITNKDTHVNTLAFRERFNGSPLSPDLPLTSLWPYPSTIPGMGVPAYTIIPEVLRHTPFETYLCGSTPTGGYGTIEHAVTLMYEAIDRSGPGRAFYYLYLWDLDSLGHKAGTADEGIDLLLATLDTELNRLWDSVKGKADMVITADHGQIDADEPVFITPEHPLTGYLETLPYGEPRAVQLRVKPDRVDEFTCFFRETLGEHFDLHATKDTAGMFGAAEFSEFARVNFGNYLAVAKERNLMIYTPGDPASAKVNKGEHGGVLPEERLVPLIIPR